MAVIDVAAGVVAVTYPGITAEVLAIVVGIWAIFGGVAGVCDRKVASELRREAGP